LVFDGPNEGRAVSYVVEILSGRMPVLYEEAIGLRDRLAELRDARVEADPDLLFEPASPELAALHQRLTSRYPCICDDESGPWSDGPLINNFGRHMAAVGMSYSRVEEVLPFVIEASTGMGFWVLDGQDEVAHLPGGRRLRPGARVSDKQIKPWWRFW
jgi:hypothetical protein